MATISLPSDLELQALSVVYAEGSSTVAAVLEGMPDQRERAYTTILSVMQSLERKGLVKSKREGRAYVYYPTKSQESIVAPLAKDFVQNAFGGSVGDAILLLLSTGQLTPEEKSAVECVLRNHKAMAAKKKTTKKKAAAKRKPAKKAAAKRKPAKKAAKKKVAKKKVAKKAAKKAAKEAASKRNRESDGMSNCSGESGSPSAKKACSSPSTSGSTSTSPSVSVAVNISSPERVGQVTVNVTINNK